MEEKMSKRAREACEVIETFTEGIPWDAIRTLRKEPLSKELLDRILLSLDEIDDTTKYFIEEKSYWIEAPLWYMVIAEAHICEELIDPVIKAICEDEDVTSLFSEQLNYVFDMLLREYTEVIISKVVNIFDKNMASGMPIPNTWIPLVEVLYHMDREEYSDWMVKVMMYHGLAFPDFFAEELSTLGVKKALPAMKKAARKTQNTFSRRIIEARIDDLQSYDQKDLVSHQPYDEFRGSWEEYYKDLESKFDIREYAVEEEKDHELHPLDDLLKDLNIDPEEALRRMEEFLGSQEKQKTGRNDFCPCGSGKKYKKCCEKKDLEELSGRVVNSRSV
ncbi:MAG: SEC-C metal-binding domain-containing protein [Candidatus Dojkabacteria bacterium]